MAPATAARLLVVGVLGATAARCGGDSPASPATPSAPVQSTVAVASAPTPLVAAHSAGDPDTKYRITANLTFQETGGKAARITKLQVAVSGASGWSSSTVHSVDIQVAARGTSTYTLTSVVDIGGPDTTGTWKLDASGTDADGAALGCKQAQADLRIVDPPVPDAVLVGAGDMAGCGMEAPIKTAKLVDRIPGIVFTVGDNVYPAGSPTIYPECYGPSWGRHMWRTRPLPGNHDWDSSGSAAAYFAYFGAASEPPLGYYSYSAGAWHVVALNSNIAAHAGSAQYEWLKADLAASATSCLMVVWHHPLFSSGQNGNSSRMRDAWRLLQQWGAEFVVSGHDHTYERFAPQDADGRANPSGLRQFVVGTGGYSLYDLGHRQANSEVFENRTWGVIKFTLKRQSYEWEFVPIDGQTFRDAGSAACSVPGAR
jgi:3',5'-cyclic AMP phosphodiesterase CpdA